MDETRYVDALLQDFKQELAISGKRRLKSLFFGGGTPSLFSAKAIERILTTVSDQLIYDDTLEITLEANPGTFEQDKFTAYRAAGVNRLSIGIQSFNDNSLKNLGRIHDADEARSAIFTAQRAGFDNINVDLMYGLPEQSLKLAIEDIEIACGLNVQHISHYQLTLEPNTLFHKQPPVLPGSELIWQMQQNCHSRLNDQGFKQYEVSAFAQENRQSQHNLNYWQFGDYMGIGAGAHGKLTEHLPETKIQRRWKRRQPEDYMSNSSNALSGEKNLPDEEIIFEFLLNALRLKQGCSYQHFENHTGLDRRQLIKACQNIDNELLLLDKERIRTSDLGYRYLDSILQQFL